MQDENDIDPLFLRIARRIRNPFIVVPTAVVISVAVYLLILILFELPIENKGIIISAVIPLCVGTPASLLTYLVVKHIESQRNEIIDQKRQLEKINQTKSMLLSIMAHDLRSPISSLIGMANGVRDQALSREIFEENIDKLCVDGESLLDLIDNLLRWSKAQTSGIHPNRVKVNIHDLINSVVDHTRSLAQYKNISVDVEVDRNLQALIDRDMIEIVIRNLLANAIKFSRTAGHIDITAETNGKEITITVADNGTGIESDLIEKILQKNIHIASKGTANEKGVGLGLSLCQEFLEVHDGKFLVSSQPGKGSEFSFTLPVEKA